MLCNLKKLLSIRIKEFLYPFLIFSKLTGESLYINGKILKTHLLLEKEKVKIVYCL